MNRTPNTLLQDPNSNSKRTIVNRIASFCNHVAAIGLLISYAAPFLSPEQYWIIAFFGLAYPVLLIVNLLFVCYWIVQLKKNAFYSLFIILIGWTQLNSFFQITFADTLNDKEKVIRVMSYNVKVFDLYNWTHNIETRNKIFQLIQDEAPSIMCLQEFFSRDNSTYNNLDSLVSFQKAKYTHVVYTTTVKSIHHWGIATFSKYPIVARGKVNFGYESNNICIFTDIKINKDTVRIYNMHLQSIAFGATDYQYMDDLEKNKQTQDIEHSKSIGKRLKKAFIKRAKQADLIHESIANSPYPVFVCGDFNDTPASYTYHVISKNLKDAFVESGNGLGKTYVGKFPSFRIDYILHSKSYKSYRFRTIHEELSDHYPIITYLEKN